MKKVLAAVAATTLFTPVAHAAQVDLFGSFTILGQTFSPDDDFFDPAGNSGGYLSPQSPDYIDDATDQEFRNNYDSSQPYGGMQWVGNIDQDNQSFGIPTYSGATYGGAPISQFENKWVRPIEDIGFDTIDANFVFDADVFGVDNVLGSNRDVLNDPLFSLLTSEITPLSVEPTTSSFAALFEGAEVESLSVPLTATATLDSSSDGGNPDVLIIAAVNRDVFGPDENEELLTLAIIGGSNWFEDAKANGVENLLNDIADKERVFFIEQLAYGEDDDGSFTPQGIREIQGVNTDAGISIQQRGLDETSALLPSQVNEETGGFEFTIDPSDFEQGALVWIDPEIAIGYTYQISNEDGAVAITGAATPTQDAVENNGGYQITVTHIIDGDGNFVAVSGHQYTFAVGQGEEFAFVDKGISESVGKFSLTGIRSTLLLDPEDTTIFQTGLSFFSDTAVTASQTPITECFGSDCEQVPPAVPLPLPALMLLTGLAGLGAMRRRQKKS